MRSTDIRWKQECIKILDKLAEKDYDNFRRLGIRDGVFQKPVDTTVEAPDYLEHIKHPMDLGTIRSAMLRGDIAHPDDFIALVRLVFRNASVYNPPNHGVHKLALELSKVFENWVAQQHGRR